MSPKILLIDGHSQCYQSFYAIPMLTSPTGQPVNAVYGFVATLKKLLREHKPDLAVVVFDPKGPTFRHKQYQDYKAQRKPMPDALRAQIPLIHEASEVHGLRVASVEGFEADDVIGTLAKRASSRGLDVDIVTTDKDAEQLLDPRIKLVDARRDKVTDLETLRREKGIEPSQVIECMALSGDSTDNIPGVPGIGPKTALALIREWGTLENVLEHVEDVRGAKTKENLVQFKDQARLSRELATIRTDVPMDEQLTDFAVRQPASPALYSFYRKHGFRSLMKDLPRADDQAERNYHLVADRESLTRFVDECRKQGEISVDLESTSVNPVDAEIVGISFSWEPGNAYYIPTLSPEGQPHIQLDIVLNMLRPILEDEHIKKTGHNLKYDIVLLRCNGLQLRGLSFDTMVASYVLNTSARQHGLSQLASEHLNHRMTEIYELLGRGREQTTMDKVDVERVSDYACEDADMALRLKRFMEPQLAELDLQELFAAVELPLVEVLAEMEYNGIKIDPGVLHRMSDEFAAKLKELEKSIHEAAGEEFNINSPKQLQAILFEKLGLPKLRKTRTGVSTDARVLEELGRVHPLPKLILDFRQLSKLKSTYLDQLPRMASPRTGKIHASFNQAVTATGRLSSSDPNLQNIPIRTELGQKIREAFIPSEDDYLFFSVDYSQIDLRMLAHLSGDPALVESFKRNEDIHASVATQIFSVSSHEVAEDMRRTAKAVNFGIIYGLTPFGLSQQLGCSVETAREFIERYFEIHKGVEDYMKQVIDDAVEKGFVRTILNRRRYIPEIRSDDARVRGLAERIARNTGIQGSAADLIKVAMNRIHQRIRDERKNTRMLLQIHDELLFEAPAGETDAELEWIAKEMEGAMELRVPLKVKTASGTNWREV